MRAVLLFATGGVILVIVTLFGPNVFPLSVKSDRPSVYLTSPFQLVDQDGRRVTEQDFRTKPTAWFFGFTHCPDVCPTTLADLSAALEKLGADGDRLNVVFVTVDPERDTPEVLKAYLSSFDPRIIALTGSRQAVNAIAKNYFVHHTKMPQKDGGYSMEHTAKLLLTAATGRFVGTMDHQDPIQIQIQKLRKLISER